MKELKLICIAVFITTFILSCKTEKSNDIVGTWSIKDVSSTGEIPKELEKDVKAVMDEYKSSYLLVINADSTFQHTISGTTSIGKWNLSPDSKTLTLSYDNGVVEVSDIMELSSKKMVTSIEINNSKNTIIFVKEEKK